MEGQKEKLQLMLLSWAGIDAGRSLVLSLVVILTSRSAQLSRRQMLESFFPLPWGLPVPEPPLGPVAAMPI